MADRALSRSAAGLAGQAKHLNRALAGMWQGLVGAGTISRGTPLAVLDMGSSKVCCYIVRARPGRGIQMMGRGFQVAEGLRTGEVVDADAAETSVLATLHEAEQQAGVSVRRAVVTMSGGGPRSVFHHVSMPLQGRTVDGDDVRRLLARARRAAGDTQRAALHVTPLEMRLDDGRALDDPIGLAGGKLDMFAHVLTVRSAALRDLVACVERCHLDVRGVVSSGYAAGLASVTDEERERGCLVLDMGGGTTDIAHFCGGRLAVARQVPFGGDHVTRDLAFGLHTSHQHAERIKNLFGAVVWRSCDDNARIEVPCIGDHVDLPTGEVPRTLVTQIVRSRVEDIFEHAQEKLREHLEFLRARPPRSIVLTGGASQLEGIEDLAQEMFCMPARRGRPGAGVAGGRFEDDPGCASITGALGLLLDDAAGDDVGAVRDKTAQAGGLFRVGRWIRESF